MATEDPSSVKDRAPAAMKKSESDCSLHSSNDLVDGADYVSQLKSAPSEKAATTRAPRKKGIAWTEEEHRQFLLGLQRLGKGDWRGISWHYVRTRTPTQVASHAQKYFIRQQNSSKRKKRSSLFDLAMQPAEDAENSHDSTREAAVDTSCATSTRESLELRRPSVTSLAHQAAAFPPHNAMHGYHQYPSFPIQDHVGMQLAAQLQALRSLATASSISTVPTPSLPVAPLNAVPFGFTVPIDPRSFPTVQMPLFYNPSPMVMPVAPTASAPVAAVATSTSTANQKQKPVNQRIYRPVASLPGFAAAGAGK